MRGSTLGIAMTDKQKPYYIIDGKVYARVTRILSIIRDIEYGGNPDPTMMNEAASIGTKVHHLIEADINAGLKPKPSATEAVNSCMQAYSDWKRTRMPVNPKSEVLVWSEKHMVACTIDLIDDEYITDFKTSARLLTRHWLQVNAYSAIYQEWWNNHGNIFTGIPQCRLLRLDKTLAMYEEKVEPFSEERWKTFLDIKEVYIDLLGSELLDGELEIIGGEHGDTSG